jgi:putative ABC transport system permease protein
VEGETAELQTLAAASTGGAGEMLALALAGAALEQTDEQRTDQLDRDGKFGKYTEMAIPLCLGDYLGKFRVVGTIPEMFEDLHFGENLDREFKFAAGRNFERYNKEHGYFEAIVGANVAAEIEGGIRVGEEISPSHGAPDGHTHARKFTVVGILAPTGTPNDRAVFINMDGFYLMEDHAKPLDKGPREPPPPSAATAPDGNTPQDDADPKAPKSPQANSSDESKSPDELLREAARRAAELPEAAAHAQSVAAQGDDLSDSEDLDPLPIEQREVTAILIGTKNIRYAPGMENMINEGPTAQAVAPVREIYNLFSFIVEPIQMVLLGLTALICVVSGISILVSIYNSMSERKHDIAVMRALGAGRETVMTIILLESILLSAMGGGAGWLLAHVINALVSGKIADTTGVTIHFWDFAPSEWLVVAGLLTLAVIVGFLPAVSAYRTDVARSLGK